MTGLADMLRDRGFSAVLAAIADYAHGRGDAAWYAGLADDERDWRLLADALKALADGVRERGLT